MLTEIYARIYVCGLDFRDNILTNQKEKILSTFMNGIILSCKHKLPVSEEELQYFVRIFEATLSSPIS